MPRVKRKTRNQELFREVNERIADAASRMDVETLGLICECSRTGCTEIINVSLATYARIRENSNLFLLKACHEDLAHEDVIEHRGDYLIVETMPGQMAWPVPVRA